MSLQLKQTKGYVIIAIGGRLDVHRASELESEINQIVAKHTDKDVVLNLEDVEYMSSSGLRVFVSLMRYLKETKRSLKLCCLSSPVRKVFEVVELTDMFHITLTEEEAVRS